MISNFQNTEQAVFSHVVFVLMDINKLLILGFGELIVCVLIKWKVFFNWTHNVGLRHTSWLCQNENVDTF